MTPALALLRPHQWIKNLFVFAGVLFGHAWSDPVRLPQAIAAFAAFSLLASAVYVLNDLVDREQDRLHPEKKLRPLAAASISVPAAIALGLACLAGGSLLALTLAGSQPWIFFLYLALNVAYSFWLKHVVGLDVLIICAGFMLRLLAGTSGIDIAPSHWLLACGLWLTLFLGFAKRRSELTKLGDGHSAHRRVLANYHPVVLDRLINFTAVGTIVSYGLYTFSANTMALHGTQNMLLTVAPVAYGILRYRARLYAAGAGEDPARTALTDPHLIGASAVWLTLVVALLS